MKYSLIVLAALTGSYAYSNNFVETKPAKIEQASQNFSVDSEQAAPKGWRLYSFNKDKTCLLDGNAGKNETIVLSNDCRDMIPGLNGPLRLVGNQEGYNLIDNDNSAIVKFGPGELNGFESYYPEHIHLVIEPASDS